jgi:CheY-like chemotaxis protein
MERAVALSRPGRILLVDDEEDILHLLKSFLTDAGHRVDTSRDGDEALALIAQRTYDLAIIDLHMPVMDGFELCRRIRERDTERRLPILFLTAHFDEEEWSDRARELGADDFIHKPVTRRTLLARVGALLRLVHASQEQSSFAAVRSLFETLTESAPACVLALGAGASVIGVAGRVQEVIGAPVDIGVPLQRALPLAFVATPVLSQLVLAALGATGKVSRELTIQDERGTRTLKATARALSGAGAGGPIQLVLVLETLTGREAQAEVLDLGLADFAAAAADIAGAIEARSAKLLDQLRFLGQAGEHFLRLVETVASIDPSQQIPLTVLRERWRSAFKESALGARGILDLAQALRGGLPPEDARK